MIQKSELQSFVQMFEGHGVEGSLGEQNLLKVQTLLEEANMQALKQAELFAKESTKQESIINKLLVDCAQTHILAAGCKVLI
jgi:hypothetical protein